MSDPFKRLGVPRNASAAQVHKAYLSLARRWHPDRFPEGQERLWAEKNMIEINIAYEEAAQRRNFIASDAHSEYDQLKSARRLMETGQLTAARRALMLIATRCAEWNYLFGAVLLKLGDVEKAALYFGVASRQCPQNDVYKTALSSALSIRRNKRQPSIFKSLKTSESGKKKTAAVFSINWMLPR